MRSQQSDQRRYFDDDQQRDSGQQYRRYSRNQEGGGYDENRKGNRWPEESGSNKNNDSYGNSYEDYRAGRDNRGDERWQADDQQRTGRRMEDRQNQTLRSNYENRYFSGGEGSRQAFDPSQNDRPGEHFKYSPYVNDNRNSGEQQQRRMKQGFGGRNKQRDNQGMQGNNIGQQRYGSGSMSEAGFGSGAQSNQYDQRNRGGTDWNRFDNPDNRNEDRNDSRNRYGNNYGQGYYGASENQGWSQEDEDRNYNQQRDQRGNQQEGNGNRNPNIRGQYGSSNYSNMRDRNTGGTDFNSTNRYYSRTRDNDPFV